jgi:hypothetical protein
MAEQAGHAETSRTQRSADAWIKTGTKDFLGALCAFARDALLLSFLYFKEDKP